MKTQIDAGKPIIAGINLSKPLPSGQSEHVTVIAGYDDSDSTILINDPFPYSALGITPYDDAGATSVQSGQYRIKYKDFRDELNWVVSLYNITDPNTEKRTALDDEGSNPDDLLAGEAGDDLVADCVGERAVRPARLVNGSVTEEVEYNNKCSRPITGMLVIASGSVLKSKYGMDKNDDFRPYRVTKKRFSLRPSGRTSFSVTLSAPPELQPSRMTVLRIPSYLLYRDWIRGKFDDSPPLDGAIVGSDAFSTAVLRMIAASGKSFTGYVMDVAGGTSDSIVTLPYDGKELRGYADQSPGTTTCSYPILKTTDEGAADQEFDKLVGRLTPLVPGWEITSRRLDRKALSWTRRWNASKTSTGPKVAVMIKPKRDTYIVSVIFVAKE